MAVVPPGYFGDYFSQYNQLTDSRNWNTKSYDYAVVKNKGEIGEEARNESSAELGTATTNDDYVYGKGLFVKTNKNYYVNAAGEKIEDKENPIYQIRDNLDRVDNNYFVDQKKGDVYFRPTMNGNEILLPATTPVNSIEPQYFGTAFTLQRPPNPEDFGTGAGQKSNITFSSTGTNDRYAEIIVNGVPIQVGNLDTTGVNAAAPTAANALYVYSNSFIAGSDNFSPIGGTWTYQPNGGAGYYESTGASVSNFNQRTADNFITRIKILNAAGTGPGLDAGVQLRTNKPDDSIGTSGYYVFIDAGGTVRVNKAGVGIVGTSIAAPASGDLEIRMNGSQIIVNNTVLFDDNDPNLYGKPYYDGYLSLRSGGGTKRFDDFELISYPASIQLLAKAFKEGENSIVVKGYDTTRMGVTISGTIYDNRRPDPVTPTQKFGVNIGTGNLLPNLNTLNGGAPSITSRFYRDDTISGANTFLDDDKAYWSVSERSALGIAGKILFQNKEGGSIQRTKDQFMGINSLMQNLNSLLGAEDDLFNSHLSIFK